MSDVIRRLMSLMSKCLYSVVNNIHVYILPPVRCMNMLTKVWSQKSRGSNLRAYKNVVNVENLCTYFDAV